MNDDLISRSEAVALILSGKVSDDSWVYECPDECNSFLDWAAEEVGKMPSAERKKGKWTETNDGWDGTYFVCSECGCPWTLIEGSPEDNGMNFCPNCGAEMRGEEDEAN